MPKQHASMCGRTPQLSNQIATETQQYGFYARELEGHRFASYPSSMNTLYDVIIVGAGAAGLSCADTLLEANRKILIIEARNHIGGRACTQATPHFSIDLGAEFVHGNPQITMDYLKQFDMQFYDVDDKHIFFDKGKFVENPNFWDALSSYTKKISKRKKTDQSIQQFIDSRGFANTRSLKSFKSFIEGFHGADLSLIGEKGLLSAEEIHEDDDLNGSDQFRLLKGYSFLWEKLVLSRKGFLDQIRFDTVVKEIDYSEKTIFVKTKSHLSGERKTYKARKVVVTVPLGVLNQSSGSPAGIEWKPDQPNELKHALQSLETGHVQKLVFQFRSRFWESLRKDKINFIHAGPGIYFPTWWTYMPLRTPYLTAWQGGPKALEMSQWPVERIRGQALSTLALFSGKKVSQLEDELIACYHHNWSTDPYSMGAYSYIVANGMDGARGLKKSSTQKIFFAGEATQCDSTRGTVHGALLSGRFAAEQILKKPALRPLPMNSARR